MTDSPIAVARFTSSGAVTPEVRRVLIDCWVDVTNAGGAAGFPFPPIDATHAASPATRSS
ncbi:hypothetical protein [Streptomyces flavofungini]|uniref:hypothetical protein n=1 Tax=Streptomyces flavofungini TaxID=68200 RepID=UPI0019AE6532|nr:hypothetical protein [Streptomyces flavofungini]GHC83534.1 hypothetical protein GCM10010349_67880 [Streptomyces flavofungini]